MTGSGEEETLPGSAERRPAGTTLGRVPGSSASPFETPQIEGYHIGELLGRGGMGLVWRAVQLSTGRQVALKILSPALLGARETQLRFEREVHLAARLQHPHIARVYDSGLHKGIYYYAMEYVEGLPLDQYVQRHRLPRHETLRLMQKVCGAVQHAHQNGVIHRDLKPSNILITDGGEPQVLDFGLAKPMDTDDATAGLSIDGEYMGTPWFMSPEQARGHARQADTRSDVYSLGVILFHLLTGNYPHDVTGTAWEVMRRVCEEEPKRPHSVDRTIDADLEALLVKALGQDPEERYATAGGLAADIGNYLSGDPLQAQPATTMYFLSKRLKKYRSAVAVALSMLAGFAVLGAFSFVRIKKERDLAEAAEHHALRNAEQARQEAKKALDVSRFLQELLASADPAEMKGADFTVRQLLDEAARTMNEKLSGQHELQARIHDTMGRAYLGLGMDALARQHALKALELYREALGDDSLEAASVMYKLGAEVPGLRGVERRYWLSRAHRIRESKLGPEHPATQLTLFTLEYHAWADTAEGFSPTRAQALLVDTRLPLRQGGRSELEQALWDALHARPPETRRDWNDERMDLIEAHWKAGDQESARRLLRDFAGLFFTDSALREHALAACRNMAAWLLRRADTDTAEILVADLLDLTAQQVGAEHVYVAEISLLLARHLQAAGRPGKAVTCFENALAIHRRQFGPQSINTLELEIELADAYVRAGEMACAETQCRTALAAVQQAHGPGAEATDRLVLNQAEIQLDRGEKDRALTLARQAGDTAPLIKAAMYAHEPIALLLLRNGADPNERDRGHTALTSAVQQNAQQLFSALLAAGADVNLSAEDGFSALTWACYLARTNMASELIARGADLGTSVKTGYTPLHWCAVVNAAPVAETLLAAGAAVDAPLGTNVWNPQATPLWAASRMGNEEMVRLLMDHGADPGKSSEMRWADGSPRRETALHQAAEKGHVAIAGLLLDRGADVNAGAESGNTPLLRAAAEGRSEVMRLLLSRGADPNVPEPAGDRFGNALFRAVKAGCADCVRALLDQGADAHVTYSHLGHTPLHVGSLAGRANAVEELLRAGASVTRVNDQGDTPLHSAALGGHHEVIRLLLEHRADVNATNRLGAAPLDLARALGHQQAVAALQAAGGRSAGTAGGRGLVVRHARFTAPAMEDGLALLAHDRLVHMSDMAGKAAVSPSETDSGDITFRAEPSFLRDPEATDESDRLFAVVEHFDDRVFWSYIHPDRRELSGSEEWVKLVFELPPSTALHDESDNQYTCRLYTHYVTHRIELVRLRASGPADTDSWQTVSRP